MKKTLEISVEDFGEALVGHIARKYKGITSMPFIVQHSSMRLDDNILVTLSDEPIHFERATGKKGNHFFPNGVTFTLSKGAVLSALAYEIAVYILARKPPVRVLEVSPELPEEIRITLKHTPKNSLVKDTPHCFDGSL